MLTNHYPARPKKASEAGGSENEGMGQDGLSQQTLAKGMSDTAKSWLSSEPASSQVAGQRPGIIHLFSCKPQLTFVYLSAKGGHRHREERSTVKGRAGVWCVCVGGGYKGSLLCYHLRVIK